MSSKIQNGFQNPRWPPNFFSCVTSLAPTRLKYKIWQQSDLKWLKYGNFNFFWRTDQVAYRSSLPELKKQKSSLYLPALLHWLSLVEKSLNLKLSWQKESYPLRRVATDILYHCLLVCMIKIEQSTFYKDLGQQKAIHHWKKGELVPHVFSPCFLFTIVIVIFQQHLFLYFSPTSLAIYALRCGY